MKKVICLLFIGICLIQCKSDESSEKKLFERPKLVVGIIVDQMRYDYLVKFWNRYEDEGFKRLINNGFNCKNNHFNYIPTYTGPGHTSVYTGTTPSVHGIIANDWFDSELGKMVYCAQDDEVNPVGTVDEAGKMSPNRMKVTTITDQLRLATQFKGKVIGIALKDRGAILPAGHTANAAYWFHGKKEGNWITSSYYMNQLPQWVADFNTSTRTEDYITQWNTLYDSSTYTEAGTDNNMFERPFKEEQQPAFPHDLKGLFDANDNYDILKTTPFGNSLTTDFALAAIDGEQLGEDTITDFLAISYSSTDYIGHQFGVNSVEVEDAYLRLDKDIARLLKALDAKVGKNNYTLFLTADHGAVDVPAYLHSLKIPAGYFDEKALEEHIKTYLKNTYGNDAILKNMSNEQLFLDGKLITKLDLELDDVQEAVALELLSMDGIEKVYTATSMMRDEFTQGVASLLQKGFDVKRSGDVLYVLSPATIVYSKQGSTHGSGFTYDTHVPLLFYGKGIAKGQTIAKTEITAIAPTLSALLGIAFPSGAIGNPIQEVLE